MKNNITTMEDSKVTHSAEMLSLYEHLGYAAGSTLGQAVYKAAKANKIPVTSHDVVTRTYTGSILKYPKSFLEYYFEQNPI